MKIAVILLFTLAAGAAVAAPKKEALPALEKLSTPDINKVVDAHKAELDKCGKDAKKKDPAATGKLRILYDPQPDGTVLNARVDTLEFRKSAVGACLTTAINKWKFPKHQRRGSPVEYTFRF